jgi:tetratricopeptide (TPR) repeat protein
MSMRSVLVGVCLAVAATSSLHAQSTVVELNEAGWKMLQSGDSVRAGRLFAEALTLVPNDPVLLFGAGASAYLDGRPREATARLERALEINPRLTGASLLLGQIAYTEGNVAQAITVYEKALKYAPNHADLTSRLASWRADADVHRDFEERRSDRFRVMFQGHADAPLAVKATDVLNAAFWRIGGELGAHPSDTVVVMLYTEQQFRDVTQAPEWAGGVYDGRIRVPAAGAARTPQSFERVLVHELTHAMIANLAPRGIPAWLHEGLAQYFEGDDPGAARRRVKAAGRQIPLHNLEGSFSRLSAADAQLAYDESLVAVDVMLHRPGLNWPSVFRALSENDRTERTLDSFGFPYSTLEAEFRR